MNTATQFSLGPTKFGISNNANCNGWPNNTVGWMRSEGVIKRRQDGTPGSRSVHISHSDTINWREKTLIEYDNQILNRSSDSLSRQRKSRITTSVQRVHQRSRSVGTDNQFAFRLFPCKQNLTNMSSIRYSTHSGGSSGFINPFKATKKFFKKIYDTATLPNRLSAKVLGSSVTVESEAPTTSVSSEYSLVDASYSLEVPDDEPSYHCDSDITSNQYTKNLCPTANTKHDRDPTISGMKTKNVIDDTMNDSGLSRSISSNDSQRTSTGDFRSWDDVFNHLKREMAYMRQRDAQIFAELQIVELQLRNVKNQAMTIVEYGNNSNNNNVNVNNNDSKQEIKLGELVESMQL